MREGELIDPQAYIADFRSRTGRMPSQVELTKALGLSPEKAIRELVSSVDGPPVQKPTESVTKRRVSFLSVAMFAIAAITFSLSVYFTSLWFTSMFHIVVAGAISVSMVSYMVLSPQAARHMKGIVKVPLWGTFIIALVFSMGSTIAGQYNELSNNVDIVGTNDRAVLDVLRSEESDLLQTIDAARRQQQFHQDTLESLSVTSEDRIENGAFIRTERNMVNELGFEIEQLQVRLSAIREQILAELSRGSTGETVERADFYTWLAGIFGADPNWIEFLVSALPAVFIDIIAALSLNMGVAVRGRPIVRE